MSKDSKKNSDTWLQALIAVIAILAIKSIFENDRSKIVSKKGSKILSDEKEMKKISDMKEDIMDGDNKQREIFI